MRMMGINLLVSVMHANMCPPLEERITDACLIRSWCRFDESLEVCREEKKDEMVDGDEDIEQKIDKAWDRKEEEMSENWQLKQGKL